MNRPARMPERGEVSEDTPLRLDVAAALLFPGGEVTGRALRLACRQRLILHYEIDNKLFVMLGDLRDFVPPAWMLTRPPGQGIVYIVGFTPYIKIGFTSGNIEDRLCELSTACPLPLEIYGAIFGDKTVERQLHARFKSRRLQGEWFRRNAQIDRWIDAGCPL